MRWQAGEDNPDVEDRRAETGGGGMGGGPRVGLFGILVLLVLSVVFKQNFFTLLGVSPGAGPAPTADAPQAGSPEDQKLVEFVGFVLKDVQDTWSRDPAVGTRYHHAKLVLFTDAVRSGCGYAERAMGPFYCPADEKVYIDLGFYQELKSRFGAPGEFAQAYVIAHEVGHHVQHLAGIEDKVRLAQERSPSQANALSVKLELQADCLAGVWGHSTQQRNILEQGDVESGLGAAAAVGDDRLQRQSGGGVNPETWTHGSSRQRVDWFKRGFDAGNFESCNTFGA